MTDRGFPGGEDLVLGHLLNRVNMGGAENYVVMVSNFHSSLGRDSQVVVLTEPGPLSGRFDPNVKVSYQGYFRQSIRHPWRFLLSMIKGYRVISRAVQDQGIEILQTHLPDSNLWGLAMALTGRCRVVATIHSNNFLIFDDGTGFGTWIKYHAYRLIVRRCAAVVTVSEEVRRSLLEKLNIPEKWAHRIVAVNNGVSVPDLLPTKARHRIRQNLGVPSDVPLLLAVGRLSKVKNFQCLIRTAALLRDRGLDFRVVIAGEGKMRQELETIRSKLGLENIVLMPGNQDGIADIMRSSDLLVVPSLWEGLPLVLLEGMACGLAAVGSRTKGVADILREEKTGLLAEVNDDEGFANAVEDLLNDSARRQEMGAFAREVVLENYSLQNTYRELCRVYAMARKP